MIRRFQSILFVSVFHGSLAVAIIMIDGSEKHNHWLDFEFQISHFTEQCNSNTNCFTFLSQSKNYQAVLTNALFMHIQKLEFMKGMQKFLIGVTM